MRVTRRSLIGTVRTVCDARIDGYDVRIDGHDDS
jgi:hypothetical protein